MLASRLVTPQNDPLWAAIERTDFSFVQDRATTNHERFAREILSYGMRDYKQFLYLLARYPNTLLVPSKLVDLVWHEHILDTQNYANDCVRLTDITGAPRFIHHNPRVMPGTAKHGGGMGERNRLLQLHFGIPHPYDMDTMVDVSGGGSEGSPGCGGQGTCGGNCA